MMNVMQSTSLDGVGHQDRAVGFSPDEILIDEPTRNARLKWVIVVDSALPPGRIVNAAVCVASATAAAVPGLLGPSGPDGDGSIHPGLPWSGCSVLAATAPQLRDVRRRAHGSEEVFVADMPALAQHTRVYRDYLAALSASPSEELDLLAVSLIGPRRRIDKLVGKLRLLP